MEQITRKEKAKELFLSGYNCSQSIVLAFADMLDADEATLSKIACSFGGGMGRLREVCGSVSGAFMVLGLLFGYPTPEKGGIKQAQYERVQEIAHRFEKLHGSIVCRELLGLNVRHDEAKPDERTPEYYKKRPCGEIIASMAEILDSYIEEHKNELI